MSRALPPLALLVLGACAPGLPRTAGIDQARFALSAGTNRLPVGDGRVSVVVFFATWSEAAKTLLPGLDELRRRLSPAAVAVTAIAVDEDQRFVGPWLREHGVELPVIADPGGRRTLPGLRRVPTVMVFDAAGTLREAFEGATGATVPQVERSLEAVRAPASPPR